jgi:hypothetical protein
MDSTVFDLADRSAAITPGNGYIGSIVEILDGSSNRPRRLLDDLLSPWSSNRNPKRKQNIRDISALTRAAVTALSVDQEN